MGFIFRQIESGTDIRTFLEEIEALPEKGLELHFFNREHNAEMTMGTWSGFDVTINGKLDAQAIEAFFDDEISHYSVGMPNNSFYSPKQEDNFFLIQLPRVMNLKHAQPWYRKCIEHLGIKKRRWSSKYDIEAPTLATVLNLAQEYHVQKGELYFMIRGRNNHNSICYQSDRIPGIRIRRGSKDKEYTKLKVGSEALKGVYTTADAFTNGLFSQLSWDVVVNYTSSQYVPSNRKNIDTVANNLNAQLSEALKRVK